MCTSILLKGKTNSVFGRNLDVEEDILNKSVIITPRNYPLSFKCLPTLNNHFSFIGMGIIVDNYPLYFDGANEKGLAIASLNFPVYGVLNSPIDNKLNLTSYEIINYILANFCNVNDVKKHLKKLNIVNIKFKEYLDVVSLHYLISDKSKSIVLEQTKDGINIYDNPYNILTNAPEFKYHLANIVQYLHINNKYPKNYFKNKQTKPYCVGLNMIGIPGDYSSNSRFIKGAYLINNCMYDDNNIIVTHMHILDNLKMVKGIAKSDDLKAEFTSYSCSIDLNSLSYYFKNYNSISYKVISLFDKQYDLNSTNLISFLAKDN